MAAVKKKAEAAEAEEIIAPAEAEVIPKAEAPKKQKEAEKASFFVYLGPNILGVIQTGSIFTGTREEVLKRLSYATDRYPRIRNLLASEETIVVDRVSVTTPGTRLYNEYRKLVAEVRK